MGTPEEKGETIMKRSRKQRGPRVSAVTRVWNPTDPSRPHATDPACKCRNCRRVTKRNQCGPGGLAER